MPELLRQILLLANITEWSWEIDREIPYRINFTIHRRLTWEDRALLESIVKEVVSFPVEVMVLYETEIRS